MDWLGFLQTNNIHYATSGPNVAKNHVCIHCIWCGSSDEGQHLSISLTGQGFRCWRQPRHAGRNPAKLIQALLNCSWDQAEQLAGQAKTLPNDFLNKVKASIIKSDISPRVAYPKIPLEFKPLSPKPSCRPFVDYLRRRSFTDQNIFEDTVDYDIYYAKQGNYRGRIVFTIWHEGKLCGWTGRTVYDQEQLRYKTLTSDAEKAKDNGEIAAPNPVSYYLLFSDLIQERDADTLVLVEGPFDAWRVNLLGESIGAAATCFFTSTLSREQLNLLHALRPKFKKCVLLLDQNTFTKAARIKSDMAALDISVKRLPATIKDPGEIKSVKELQMVLA